MLKQRYQGAQTLDEAVEAAEKLQDLWRTMARRVRAPDDLVSRVEALGGEWHLLVLSEDWCGDAVNTVPHLAALAAAADNLDLRVLARDRNPDLMDAHLTHGTRSIPVVMVLDEEYEEVGWWGPRPRELQAWATSPEARAMDSKDRYRAIRTWYARDHGRSTLEEVVELLERAARRQPQRVR